VLKLNQSLILELFQASLVKVKVKVPYPNWGIGRVIISLP